MKPRIKQIKSFGLYTPYGKLEEAGTFRMRCTTTYECFKQYDEEEPHCLNCEIEEMCRVAS